MNRSDILYSGKICFCYTIRSWRCVMHRKLIPYVGQYGKVVGGAKNGQLLVQFGNSKNTISVPHCCVTFINFS